MVDAYYEPFDRIEKILDKEWSEYPFKTAENIAFFHAIKRVLKSLFPPETPYKTRTIYNKEYPEWAVVLGYFEDIQITENNSKTHVMPCNTLILQIEEMELTGPDLIDLVNMLPNQDVKHLKTLLYGLSDEGGKILSPNDLKEVLRGCSKIDFDRLQAHLKYNNPDVFGFYTPKDPEGHKKSFICLTQNGLFHSLGASKSNIIKRRPKPKF